jgi:signal transduction histidine kinase
MVKPAQFTKVRQDWDTFTFRVLLIILVTTVYAWSFLQVYSIGGYGFFILSVMPVMLAGWLLGVWAGIIAGIFIFPTHLLLLILANMSIQLMIQTPASVIGSVIVIIIGALFGRLHDLSEGLLDANIRLQKMDATKDEFLSLVSHDLKNPIFSMLSFTDILLDGLAGEIRPEQKEHLQAIKRQGKMMTGLVDSILDYTRLEFGKNAVEPEEFDLNKLILQEVEEFKPLADHRHQELSLSLPLELMTVRADKTMVRRVISNLIGNALKYTQEKGVVKVELKRIDSQAQVLVADSGKGIPREYLDKVFEKYFRVPGSPSTGTGLGLAISKEFITNQKGKIWAESRPGQGSTFFFTLPVAGA